MKTPKLEFGTETNPLILEKINTPRPLISRCVRFNPEARNSSELVSIDFGKYRGKVERGIEKEYAFLKNLLSNPHLSTNALKLGLYFNIYICDNSCDIDFNFFVLAKNNELLKMKQIFVGNPRTNQFLRCKDVKHFIDLTLELKKLSSNMTKTDVISALQELHDFQYLTVTEVKYENSYIGRKARKKEAESKNREQDLKQPTFLSEQCALVCITLTKQLFEKNFSGKWTPMLNI